MGRLQRRSSFLALFRAQPRFLAFGVTMTFASSYGQTYCISMFGDDLKRDFALGAKEYGEAYALATALAGFSIMWVGRLIDHTDLRLWTAAVLGGLVGACLTMSVASSVLWLGIAFFALRLTGQGLMSHTAFTSLGRYFDRERGKAMSLAGLGFALGFAVFPKMLDGLLEVVPWRDAWRVLAASAALGVLPLALWLLRGQRARHQAFLEGWSLDPVPDVEVPLDPAPLPRQWTRPEVLRDPRFWLVLPLVLACPFLMTGLIFHQLEIGASKGWDRSLLANGMIAMGAGQYVTLLLVGPLVDRFGACRLLPFTQVPLALGLLVLAAPDGAWGAPVYLGLAGVTMGSLSPVMGSLWPELYGTRHLGAIRAATSAAMVLSTALAPFLFGVLLNRGASPDLLGLAGVAFIAVGVLGVLAARLGPRT